MASIIPNQPIMFNMSDDCWLEDSGIKLLAAWGDTTSFQMDLEPSISDVELIQNGNFSSSSNWTLGPNWTISGGQACHALGVYGVMSQVAPVSNDTLVRLTFDIEVTTGGILVQYGSYMENFFTSGSYERWIVADGASSIAFASNGSAAVCVSNVSAYTINTNFIVQLEDDEGTVQYEFYWNLYDFGFCGGKFTFDIDWEAQGVRSDCYRFNVIDPADCSQNGIIPLDFVSGLHNWSLASSWTIAGGTATYNGSSAGQAILNHSICNGTEYQVEYTLSGMGANEEFNIRLGTQNGTTRTSDGTYTDTITSNGTSFIMIGNSTSGTQTFEVTDMSIEATTKTVGFTSNYIKVSETPFSCRTLELAMCNDTNAMGFCWENLRLTMRIPASLNRSSYPMTSEAYDYSDGTKQPYYGRSRVARELGFDGKEFMHNFMHFACYVDHFYIDDVEHTVEDREYPTISWSDQDDGGGVTIQVSKKVQLLENVKVNQTGAGCLPEGSPLLDGNGSVIVDELGETITGG